jgi:hypothetical protein
MSEFRAGLPFSETQVEMFPCSNEAHCRARPIWIPGILNAWSIQISATVARIRGNVRSCRSGSMPLIVGEKNRCQVSLRIQRKKGNREEQKSDVFYIPPQKKLEK